jgi:Tfp pilus assembly protein PilE
MIKNTQKIKTKETKRGYTLLEFILYIGILSIFSTVTVNAIIIMNKKFRVMKTQTELMQGGVIMDRISREIKKASGVNLLTSDSLELKTYDNNRADKIVKFYFSSINHSIEIFENGISVGNLNSSNIEVIDLNFTKIIVANRPEEGAVKLILTLKHKGDLQNRQEKFYNTVVLRGSY